MSDPDWAITLAARIAGRLGWLEQPSRWSMATHEWRGERHDGCGVLADCFWLVSADRFLLCLYGDEPDCACLYWVPADDRAFLTTPEVTPAVAEYLRLIDGATDGYLTYCATRSDPALLSWLAAGDRPKREGEDG